MFDSLKKLLKAKNLLDAIKKAHGEGFDWKVTATKAVKNFLIVCSAVAVSALANYFSIPANLDLFFNWLPESVRDTASGLLTPAIAAGVFALKNWADHRKNEIVWVVPVAEPTSAKKISGETASKALPDAVPIAISVKPAVPPDTTPTIPKDAGA